MVSRSRIVTLLQVSTIVVLGIWAAAYGGLIGTVPATWLSLSVVALTLLLSSISRQTEQPKSMSQILADLENPRQSK